MSTTVTTRIDDASAILRVAGRFDFSTHVLFRSAIKAAIGNPAVRRLVVDLSATDYVDSAALGMLLLSRENAIQVGKQVALRSPSATVKPVLDIANFHKLFDIG